MTTPPRADERIAALQDSSASTDELPAAQLIKNITKLGNKSMLSKGMKELLRHLSSNMRPADFSCNSITGCDTATLLRCYPSGRAAFATRGSGLCSKAGMDQSSAHVMATNCDSRDLKAPSPSNRGRDCSRDTSNTPSSCKAVYSILLLALRCPGVVSWRS